MSDTVADKMSQLKNLLLEHKKKVIIVIVVIVIILLLYFAIPKLGKHRVVEKIELMSSTPEVIPNCEISESLTGNFSCSLWINIKDFFVNFKNWRHIVHKGTEIKKNEIIDYDEWVDIEKYIPNQSPGLWLDPIKNNLRLCFTVETQDLGNYEEHPINVSKIVRRQGYTIRKIEYVDIVNIPVKMYHHILFTVEGRLVTIYLDGSIVTQKILKGDIVSNKGNFYIHQNKTYEGDIKKLLYFPFLLKSDEINVLYTSKPE